MNDAPTKGSPAMLLYAKGLRKSYCVDHRVLEVLRGVDLAIAVGEMVAIVGPSGAGKSTLLHLLGGLDKPTQGQVVLEQQDWQSLRDVQRARLRNEKIGFVFQSYHLLGELSCLENVMLPAIMHASQAATGLDALCSEAQALLAELGLEGRAAHRPNQLSGGEQQRCAIARALINKPKLILADEPTGNLDRQTSRILFDVLMQLRAKRDVAMVIVTHDQELAGLCPRQLSMVDGCFSAS